MIVRALDSDHDWQFGKGRNDYKRNALALAQNINTRLNSFVGDCFFDTRAGVDWFNLLGSKKLVALKLAISSVILNTENVTGILQVSLELNADRNFTATYRVQTNFGSVSNTFQYDFGGV